MKSKNIWIRIGLVVTLLAMFAWIFVAVALTGGREIEEFTPRDEKIMAVFLVVEILTMIAMAVLAVLVGRENGRNHQENLQKLQRSKQPVRGIGWLALVFLVYLGAVTCGNIAAHHMPETLRNSCAIVFIGCGVMVAVLLILNGLLCKRLHGQLEKKSVAQMQAYLDSHREHAQETVAEKQPLLARCRRWTAVYAVLLGLLGLTAAFSAGIWLKPGVAGGLSILVMGLLMCPVSRIRYGVSKAVLEDNPGYVDRGEYQKLYALADSAAKKLGCDVPIRILLRPDCGAAIALVGKYCMVQLGVLLLGMLTEEELTTILLHEFSHITGQSRQMHKEDQYYNWVSGQHPQSFYSGFISRMFAYSDTYYQLQYALYRYAASLAAETAADRAMLLAEQPQNVATALVKTQYYELYRWQRESWEEASVYEPEEPAGGMLARELESFREAAGKYAQSWDTYIEKELPSRAASHPTVAQRLKDLGLMLPRQVAVEAPVESLCGQALAYLDGQLFDHVQKTYAENREAYYLKPLQSVAAWEQEGKPVIAEGYGDIVWALRQLGRTEASVALCQQAIDELPLIAAAEAYFIRGCTRLHGFDSAGIEDVYTAMETNANYVEEGLAVLGAFCCLTGNREELERYRQRGVELTQKFRDEDRHAGFLQKKDKISPEALPEGMLEDILQYIRSVDEGQIRRIYLVRKTVNESFFTSVFVVEFEKDTGDAVCGEILHKIFRYLDTCSNWQFSLYDRRDVPGVPLESVENSCVFEKL